jgi:hypothetical protein
VVLPRNKFTSGFPHPAVIRLQPLILRLLALSSQKLSPREALIRRRRKSALFMVVFITAHVPAVALLTWLRGGSLIVPVLVSLGLSALPLLAWLANKTALSTRLTITAALIGRRLAESVTVMQKSARLLATSVNQVADASQDVTQSSHIANDGALAAASATHAGIASLHSRNRQQNRCYGKRRPTRRSFRRTDRRAGSASRRSRRPDRADHSAYSGFGAVPHSKFLLIIKGRS